MLVFIIVFCLVFLVFEIYSYQALKTLIKNNTFLTFYKIFSFVIFLIILYFFTKFDRRLGMTRTNMYTMGALLLVLVPKMVVTFFMLSEDIIRILTGIVSSFINSDVKNDFLPARRKFVSQIALGLAAVPFLSLIYGITIGRYNFKVIKQRLYFPDLPEAFDGFRITQISDVHSGSFDNPEKISYAIDLVNEQNSDLILFTGDIVNNKAEEMHPWIDVFNRIEPHKYGKFAVLGNHDYGEYIDFPSFQAKEENFQAIKKLYGQIGFDLLLNEHKFINKDNEKLAIVGVENWGKGFKQAGDLEKASANLSQKDFKILMSHDPSHWEYEVKNHKKNFQLTLSGHTHGMQFGIEIPGIIKWSLAQFAYKQWAGLYENLGRFIYVNRGFGFHAYPGRVGIMPEITVIELKKAKNNV
ncbi:MAG: metallophosphoesterase [Flavobacterium sp.]|nr:metallophosphoesterase [Flavobacterium sp.]